VLYFDDDSFTGYTDWETIEKLRERADTSGKGDHIERSIGKLWLGQLLTDRKQ
jgi:hypothetical protein